MLFNPIQYEEPLFRPPAEANSVIIQATIGCSWNKCAFCEMYTSKKFRIRNYEDIKKDIEVLAKFYKGTKKIFLADGDAFVLSESKLSPILSCINEHFGRIQRISSYALPKDILAKTDKELENLKNLGLKLLYIGIETGDDELLKLINKGETYQSTLEGIKKAHKAGIDTSIMILNGLGGRKYAKQHALNSAKIINELNPKFLSTLTLSFPYGEKHYKTRFSGNYQQQSLKELFIELKDFINGLHVNNVIFRSNHVSNNLLLKGTLSKDKELILNQLNFAIDKTDNDIFPKTPSVL